MTTRPRKADCPKIDVQELINQGFMKDRAWLPFHLIPRPDDLNPGERINGEFPNIKPPWRWSAVRQIDIWQLYVWQKKRYEDWEEIIRSSLEINRPELQNLSPPPPAPDRILFYNAVKNPAVKINCGNDDNQATIIIPIITDKRNRKRWLCPECHKPARYLYRLNDDAWWNPPRCEKCCNFSKKSEPDDDPIESPDDKD